MNQIFKYFAVVFVFLICNQVDAQMLINVKTQVLESYTDEPIHYAHIINLRDLKGDVCDIDGFFDIKVLPSDTIRISAIGYKTQLISASELINADKTFNNVVLDKGLYQLNEVLIRYIPPPDKFKEAFMELDIENPSAEIAKNMRLEEIKNQPAISFNPETGMATYTIEGPITFLYNKLSKKQRMLTASRLKLEKYNVYKTHLSSLATIVTGFENRQEIDEFLRFCNLELNFIKQHNDYDLVIVLNNYFMDYISN